VSGPVALETPAGVERVNVRTARQMFDAVKTSVKGSDVFIAVAAVADWRVKKIQNQKIKKKNGRPPTLEFAENPDILAWVAAQKNPPFCVGFAAESENVGANAKQKRLQKGVPLIAANRAQDALGADDNAITLYDARGRHPLGRGPKLEQARKLVAHVAGMLKKR
jgi:phosphopantothenoylcysteine decarboxylase/phosphopantothenate--cysteine ligase